MAENKRKRDPELESQIKRQTSLEGMLGSLDAALNNGYSIPQPKSSASRTVSTGGILQPEDHHIDLSHLDGKIPSAGNNGNGHRIGKNAWGQSLLVNNPKQPNHSKQAQSHETIEAADIGDLTPLIADIMSFQYSENNRQSEINQIHAALKVEMIKLCAKRVVSNTQKNVKTAKNFYMGKNGSLRIEFSILGQKYSMLTQGSFRGDEILYPTVEGDNVVGLVMREGSDGLRNATSEFKISIIKGWKE